MAKLITIILITFFSITGNSEEISIKNARLYALNCGTTEVSDMKDFSIDGKLDGEKATLIVPCFLIGHPKGYLLWDTGHAEMLADMPDGFKFGAYHLKLKDTLIEQIKQLGLNPSDINYLSISHSHDDHSGNANQFVESTFIINALEHKFMFSDEKKNENQAYQNYAELEESKTILFEDEFDVFGDKTVLIKSMPGHTPGSSILLLRLKNAGNILLTGDLYTHDMAREMGTVPVSNSDRVDTLESRKRFEILAGKENARVVIQHSKSDFEALATFPGFID